MPPGQVPRSRRAMAIGTTLLVATIFTTGAMVAQRARREAHAEELLILQGVRRVCKLATVELSLRMRLGAGLAYVLCRRARRSCGTRTGA